MELKKERISIPESLKMYAGKILRYELRIMKSVPAYFGKNVKGKDLYDESKYNFAKLKWEEHYFRINKVNKIKFNIKVFKSINIMKKQLMILGLNSVGSNRFIDMIEHSKDLVSRNQSYRAKKIIKEILIAKELIEPNELILELDEKIKQTIQYYK